MAYKRILVPVDGSSTSARGLQEALKLARVERAARAAGTRPEAVLVENFGGRVADAIVAQAKRWRADLIVMGTHGRRGMKRVLLGSDAETVIRYSKVPVLLVPARRG